MGGKFEIFAMSGFAFAIPIYGLFGRNTEIFLNYQTSTLKIIALCIAVIIVPTVVLAFVESAISRLNVRAGRLAHLSMLGVLFALFSVRLIREAFSPTPALNLGLTAALTCAFIIAIGRWNWAQIWLRYTAFVPIFSLGLLLISSPLAGIMFGHVPEPTAAGQVGNPTRIALLVFDEFPETSILDGKGQIDSELFPNFAALQAESNWYRNNTTVAPFTEAAVPAILTGLIPPKGDPTVPPAVAANYPNNLFNSLSRTYRMHSHESLTRLCRTKTCTGFRLPSGSPTVAAIESFSNLWRIGIDPRLTKKGGDFAGRRSSGSDPAATAANFISQMQPTKANRRPQLDFLHVFIPHQPWRYDKYLRTLDATEDAGINAANGVKFDFDGTPNWQNKWNALAGRERHLIQVQGADTLLGMMMERLKAIGEWDDSLVIVTADHGIGFSSQEPLRGLGEKNAPDLAWVPLFIKTPNQSRGKIDDRPARSTDILPTVFEIIKTPIPWKTDGRSLLGKARKDGDFNMLAWRMDRSPVKDRKTTVDGVAGFQKVLKGGGFGKGCASSLRIYCVGPYWSLMGQRVLTNKPKENDSYVYAISDEEEFNAVDLQSQYAPWLLTSGIVFSQEKSFYLAIAVNDKIAGLAKAMPLAGTKNLIWSSPLEPSAFQDGDNNVDLYAITGSPDNPRLSLMVNSGL